MALTCGFYNSIYGDRKYSAIQLSSIFDGIIKDGIFATVGDAFTVSAGSEMQVIVGPGRAWFNHSWTLNDANLPIEVDDAEVVLDRIDAVVIEVNSDDSVRDNTVKMVKGRPSSEPEKPELLDTETVHQYALAYVTVRSGVTEITNADIENAVGTTETPFITGLLETIDATELMNQWNGQFQDWLREAGTSLEDWETQATTLQAQWTVEFEAWFEHLQNELDENQAAHLQHQIDELRVKSGMSAKILINSDPGSTVTVTKPDGTVVVATQVTGTTTQWECSTGEYGVHYIHSVLNGEDAQVSLNVDTCKIYTIDDDHMHADITVTFPSGFSCRCQGGGENLYATSNPFTFVVHNKTTYTITASAPGITYTETVEINTSGQTESMFCPSVENAPTDDVQMWLYFGGITDKAYTTLSEVLADSTTLMTLINDYNAVDYLVKCKSWATNRSLVPNMTSNTTPSGEVSASSYLSANYQPYMAFSTDSYGWQGSDAQGRFDTGVYIQYKFPNAVKVGGGSIQLIGGDSNGLTMELLASNDGFVSDTHTLVSSITFASTTSRNVTFAVNSTDSYTYYRLRSINNNAAGGDGMKIQFYTLDGNGITEDSTAMTYIGLNNYASNTLLADSRTALIPYMTSNTTPSGECFGSTKYSSSEDYCVAFQGINHATAVILSPNGASAGEYIGYEFAEPKIVKQIKVRIDGYIGFTSATIVPQAYDGTNWVDISTPQTISSPAQPNQGYSILTFVINTNTAYSRYRIIRTAITKLGNNFDYFYPSDIQFYDKSGVMWLEEICNSAYFESVLNAKVPVMTSNTTPSGECICDSNYPDNPAYFAFDGNNSTYWSSNVASSIGAHIGYKFTSPLKIYKIHWLWYNSTTPSITIKVRRSNDGSTWADVLTRRCMSSGSQSDINIDIVNGTDEGLYWDIYKDSTTTTGDRLGTLTLQFYGRIAV